VSEAERYKRALFDVINFRVEERLSELELRCSNVRLDAHHDMALRHLVFALDAWAAAGQKVEVYVHETTVRWPATWWQHFKQAWFPRWLLRRFPVVTATRVVKTKVVTAVNVCPHLTVDPERRHVEFLLLTPEQPRA
jgi:hypothetical protein